MRTRGIHTFKFNNFQIQIYWPEFGIRSIPLRTWGNTDGDLTNDYYLLFPTAFRISKFTDGWQVAIRILGFGVGLQVAPQF